jgi:pimeloyl-ACP methyl ester carboxylesterase
MRFLILLVSLLGLVWAAPVQAQAKLGIVLLHGKLGMNMGASSGRGPAIGARLVSALEGAGYLVATPEMCWSRGRSFNLPFPDCLREIDTAVAGLKSRGATAIVVGGLSLGGYAAIAYGATHPELRGIIGIAPADDPKLKARRPEIAAAIAKARDLAAQGKGDEQTSFDDVNTGPSGSYAMKINSTARIYLSFFDPDARPAIPDITAKLTMPLLWIAGNDDPTQRNGRGYAFDRAPANPLNRYVTVSASHLETPDAGREAVLAWLAELAKP